MNTTLARASLPSWSGLSRPSTSSLVEGGLQDVDARHKGEHDANWTTVMFMGSGLRPAACPEMTVRYTANDVPQPQELVAFGLVMRKD